MVRISKSVLGEAICFPVAKSENSSKICDKCVGLSVSLCGCTEKCDLVATPLHASAEFNKIS